MRPAARLSAAIAVLEEVEAGDARPERVLSAWGRANRYAGSKDRAAIADLVYDVLRRRRSLAWPLRADTPRAAVIGAVLDAGGHPAALFDGSRHAPAALTADERAALASPPPVAPDPVRLDYPDWLDGALRHSLGADFEASMRALQGRAPVDLRVNTLKSDIAAAQTSLAADGVETAPSALAATCLRAAPGAPVARTAAYLDGRVELQDAASQAVALFAQAAPGQTVLDFCAGGGGKTLALAAAMQGRGHLVAHDVAPARMKDLPARLARAGARAEMARGPDALARLCGRVDLVFVDAPCSGSGAWRRDPSAKWRLTPQRLAALATAQAEALAAGRRMLRPGGVLVYATCSILASENGDRVAGVAPCDAPRLSLKPSDGADGFFAVRCALDHRHDHENGTGGF